MKTSSGVPSSTSIPISSDTGYKIGGISVEFPYKPYGSQLAFMGRVISTLDRAKKQGHCHALLESPTGTGKTLSLLCSALAWQKNCASKASMPTPDPDPLVHGGGFIPEPDSSMVLGNVELQHGRATSARAQRKQIRPTIYYASRTHSQISQVIREYRKTSYRVPMAILASRKHYCTNKHVCSSGNIDEECKLLLKDEGRTCLEYKNAQKLRNHRSFQKGGCYEAHDIEDLVKVGKAVKGCPYFAAQTMAAEADLVFCPYSYVINPVIRRLMDIDIKGSILILDEAHNIEDMARDAGSFDVEEEVLFSLQMDLSRLCLDDSVAVTYRPLHDMIQGIISWINQRKDSLEKRNFEHYCTCWTGDKALNELLEAGISQQFFPIIKECAVKAIRAASDAESIEDCLSGASALVLEGLCSSLCFLLADHGRNALDYQVALQRYIKRETKNTGNRSIISLSLWCLNPGVIFRDIADIALSVILTSGTLSPMGSFASELGVQFEACLEAPHVINAESQLWAGVISKGPGDQQLNASYKTSDGYAFQDALGETLEEICKIIPGGVLVFFPSYKLLEKLQNRWCQTGQWSRLDLQKSVFVEARGKSDDFETVLKSYYESIRGDKGAVPKKVKRGQKREMNRFSAASSQNKEGAAFLAVCRGKVSEGIDFSDDNARAVVIVGIPFPNKNDIQVTLKKNYNDSYRSSKGLLSGNEWYCHQAFRALNQAAGRCIRHRLDYGAIILIDERFNEERNLTYISRWIRKSIKRYDTFQSSVKDLKAFFSGKELLNRSRKNEGETTLQAIDFNKENMSSSKKNILSMRNMIPISWKKDELQNQSAGKRNPDYQKKDTPTEVLVRDKCVPIRSSITKCSLKAYGGEPQHSLSKMESFSSGVSPRQHRWSEISSISNCSSDQYLLMEKTALDDSCVSSFTPKDEDSHSTTVPSSRQVTQEASLHTASIINSNETFDEGTCNLLASSPEPIDIPVPEQETCLSVNSHQQKRKKMNNLDIGYLPELCCSDSHISESCVGLTGSCTVPKGLDVKAEVSLNSSAKQLEKLFICCCICKNPLGLPETSYLVSCSLTSSCKVYLNHILENGPSSNFGPDSVCLTKCKNIPVAIAVKTYVNRNLFKSRLTEGAQQHGIWSEPDGCVFKVIYCPFCTDDSTYLGVLIMATDPLNADFSDKVMFYADRLHVMKQEEAKQQVLLPYSDLGTNHYPGLIQNENNSCIKWTKFTDFSTRKTRLKLPRKM